jgi:hypothetical protein
MPAAAANVRLAIKDEIEIALGVWPDDRPREFKWSFSPVPALRRALESFDDKVWEIGGWGARAVNQQAIHMIVAALLEDVGERLCEYENQ